MSNSQFFGRDAGFYYYPTSTTPASSTAWTTYPLPMQITEVRPSYRVVQYVADSLDHSVRQVLTVTGSNSTGHYELVGTFRLLNDSSDTIQFLKAAALGQRVRYTTDLTTGTTGGAQGSGADVIMVEPTLPVLDLALDRGAGSGLEYLEITARFRRATTAGEDGAGVVQSSGDFSTASGATWF